MSAVAHKADIRQRRWPIRSVPAPDVPSCVYLDLSKVTMPRVIPLSAQFGITRQGVSTTNRSPLSVKFRTCLVPTHSGFQATSTLVVHVSPSTLYVPV